MAAQKIIQIIIGSLRLETVSLMSLNDDCSTGSLQPAEFFSLHYFYMVISPLVCRVELATTESVYLESSCGLEILIIRGLSARPTAGRWCLNYLKQLIRYLYNLSGNRVQLR